MSFKEYRRQTSSIFSSRQQHTSHKHASSKHPSISHTGHVSYKNIEIIHSSLDFSFAHHIIYVVARGTTYQKSSDQCASVSTQYTYGSPILVVFSLFINYEKMKLELSKSFTLFTWHSPFFNVFSFGVVYISPRERGSKCIPIPATAS